MAQTPSTMIPLGTPAPPFALPDPKGKVFRLEDFPDAPAMLVMFICNHCPFVKHLRSAIADLAKEYQQRGVAIIAINSNDVANYPDDSPEKMAEEARSAGYTFPYLFDETQEVAKAYDAACTPDFFLYARYHGSPSRESQDRYRGSPSRESRSGGPWYLVYRGQFDDSRPGNDIPVTGNDLRTALDAVLAGQPVPQDQKPSIGCNIKWKELSQSRK